jgi:signal peptidase I
VGGVADRRAGLTTGSTAGPPTRRWTVRRVLSWVAVVLLVLVVASVAGLLPVQVMRVDSGSMTPTIGVGDLLVVDRWHGPVHRQDVVVARHPDTGELLVKRAVGLGGDQVGIEDGVLVVNGRTVCEPTIDPLLQDGVFFGPVTVPAGDVFLLGDDRGNSIDSRDFGPVPADDVEGQVSGRVWPSPGRLPADSC